MKSAVCIFILVVFITEIQYSQTVVKKEYNSYSNAIVLTFEGGFTNAYTDFRVNKFEQFGRGSLEYFFPSTLSGTFGFKIVGGGGYLGGTGGTGYSLPPISLIKNLKTSFMFLGGGYSYILSLSNIFHPYIFVGISYLSFTPRDENGFDLSKISSLKYDKSDINYNGEIGLRLLIFKNISLNFSGVLHVNPNDNLDGFKQGRNNDLFYTVGMGLSYNFFPEEDADGDGVEDADDQCPNTPKGVVVDKFGCPIDSDNDGVPDYLDKCPNTLPNIKVDDDGCPRDKDRDGVPDYLDKCPKTPKYVKVNNKGCPVDSDGDGIPDYLDKCPGTPYGQKVDDSGCSKKIKKALKEVNKLVINKFEFGKANIPENAIPVLNKFILYLKLKPDTHWKIIGHTDNLRSYSENYILSLKRAKSVLSYFLKNGIDRKRFKIVGMSYMQPVADNELAYGRSLNRRVEIILMNKK
ncbi:alpha-agarase precursor [bacterium BMS3Abin04]|nr:alpha-agarase precursor [bacterium BMS3Abin04]